MAHKASRTAGTTDNWAGQCSCARTQHSLLTSCSKPGFVQGRREAGWWDSAPGLLGEGCFSLSQNTSPLPRSVLASQFPGDWDQPALPRNPSSPSFPEGMELQSQHTEQLQGWIRASVLGPIGPCGQTGANRLPVRQVLIKRTGEGRRELFSILVWWEQRSHETGVWQSPETRVGTWGVHGFGILRAWGSQVCTHQSNRHREGTPLPRITPSAVRSC